MIGDNTYLLMLGVYRDMGNGDLWLFLLPAVRFRSDVYSLYLYSIR